ncbi:Tol-Pal system beta propeller repeat protein TolB [Desulfolithobacter sp.]
MSVKRMINTAAGLWLLLLMILAGPVRAERIYLDITASDLRKVVIAIPAFIRLDQEGIVEKRGRAMADLLARGLEFHGFVKVLDPARYDGRLDADWKGLGVDYVIAGRYEPSGDGLLVEARLLDVADGRMLTGRRYRGAAAQQDDMVLRLCDALVEEFTGEPGISRTSIAFVSDATGRKEVYVADILGRKIRQITRHRHLTVSPRFSPDGRYLAYTSYHRGNQNLYITDLRQDKVTRAISRRKGMNLAPAFAPDGRTMVVTLSKDGSPDLYLMTVQGKILKRLTARTGINVSPSFSPDGRYLAFVSDRSGRPQIYIMDLKSGRTRRLTFDGVENSEPSWSPKGDLIAYTSIKDGRYHIFTISPNGSEPPIQVTSGPGDFESPSWSPDGKQIAFSRKLDGRSRIWAVFKNGRGMRPLFKLKGNQSYPQWSGRPQ